MTTIAFIGLGNMGGPMAANLAKAGRQVAAFDLSEAARARAVEAGCQDADSVAAAVGQADVVVTMLPAGKHVRAVYLGEDGVIAHTKKGALLIDSSTIDVDSARAVGKAAGEAGFQMVDAPVSGGVAAAAAGTLTFMVGGEKDAFERARPVLQHMGKNIFHAGQAGNGQVAKICNNMLLGASMIATCEAFNLAERLGLDAQTFFDIASAASGQCWSMTSYCPAPGPVPAAPSNRDYQPGFTAAMMLKDMRLAQEAARNAGAATPLGGLAEEIYALMEAAGKDGLDFSGVMKLIKGTL
ncbi:3-hydroxyisobutyrate dehydrogenase [Amphiplicatus metriothermophilus]|uniref:3-hydroxyisobutyrate dehydrogenase n=1 Tax=Amphiplicatus metriothermophilus TaxID=1519374 RepID=A0A239PZV1_9PROT|nr:3-hydroxyisobutyrate dehydrogenase [Amphiplicatus metriothermophilus]MBB5519783.1 3-hydroxyisobutyrate dehydrogenase [Amphiplicatus metriothermophilus]SNT75197.1 3-hydroxyisobutyrate dehydrogenase [Amphiplicatus metriothermophilus]